MLATETEQVAIRAEEQLPLLIELSRPAFRRMAEVGSRFGFPATPNDPQPTPEMIMAYLTCETPCCGFAHETGAIYWPKDQEQAIARAIDLCERFFEDRDVANIGFAYLVAGAVNHHVNGACA